MPTKPPSSSPSSASATMRPSVVLLVVLTFLHSLPSPSVSLPHSRDIEGWCSTTPHSEPCRYYLVDHDPHSRHHPKDHSEFFKLLNKVTLDVAIRAQSRLRGLGRGCGNKPEKTAWLDCWELYGNTVLQLNRTLLHPRSGSATVSNTQTWLSAALTNLETCRTGFADLRTSLDVIKPVINYNISELISNCLAVNRPSVQSDATTASDEAPDWTSVANRKLLQLSVRPNLVVAKDGSGNYRTIQEALNAAATRQTSGSGRFVIYIKAGVYAENLLQVVSALQDLTMVGDGIGKTVITGTRSVAGGYTTFSSATFTVMSDGFIASGITFQNTFGPGSQAVALLSGSDRSVFYRCSFEGYQDTLCVYSQRQFYRECDIYGTVDFIFGNAAAVLQNCTIYARKPKAGEANVITAQGRSDPNQNTGIVIQFSNIASSAEFWPVHANVSTFLGRPWREYSRTVYLSNYMSSIIDPSGWLPSNGDFGLKTLYYAEFENNGPGSRVSMRVRWPGYHVVVLPSMVKQFTVGSFISGRQWIPSTGVPFVLGL